MTSGKWNEVFELSEGGAATAEAWEENLNVFANGRLQSLLSVLAAGQRRPAIAFKCQKRLAYAVLLRVRRLIS